MPNHTLLFIEIRYAKLCKVWFQGLRVVGTRVRVNCHTSELKVDSLKKVTCTREGMK